MSGGGSRGEVGGSPPYFQTKLRPEDRKKFSETRSPPLSQGQDDRPRSLSEGLDLPLVNESVSHYPMVTA